MAHGSTITDTQAGPPDSGLGAVDRIREVGEALSSTIGRVLDALPGVHRPNGLARTLDVNRAVASRVLSATAAKDPLEVVHVIPGPEPLRQVVRAAARSEVAPEVIAEARAAIDRFDRLIRDEAGTRSALDALISSRLPGAREKFELSSKYSVFKGLSQLKGARAETWLGTAVLQPSAADATKLDLTWLNGAIAMQRLRPGVTVRFSYRTKMDRDAEDADRSSELLTLDEFCTNPPAKLETRTSGNVVNYLLPPDLLGPRSVTDLFVVDHHPAEVRRYARDDSGKRTSFFVGPALPVALMVFDVLLHEDAFPGAEPELLVYDTGLDGIANVNDRERDIDRVDLCESVEYLGHGMGDLYAPDIPSYGAMLDHLAGAYGWDPSRFRGYRTRIQYPIFGWQFCMTFEPPAA